MHEKKTFLNKGRKKRKKEKSDNNKFICEALPACENGVLPAHVSLVCVWPATTKFGIIF